MTNHRTNDSEAKMPEQATSGTATANLPAIHDEEISKIRAKGAAMVAYQREVTSIAKQIAGMEWGMKLSPATQYALAQFSRVTGANIQLHIDVLGGKPYLNANYWMDRINSDPSFHSYSQREISHRTEEGLRKQAAEIRASAAEMDPADQGRAVTLARALELEEEADAIWRLRQHYGIPDTATSAYETTIKRFINAAPLDAIRRGDIPDIGQWLTEVSEANFAGGESRTQDPVGKQHPDRTARTRSLRRCASRSFTAWLSKYDEQVRKAEEAVEAEFTLIGEEENGHRAMRTGPQAVSTDGEPAAALGAGAEDLPGTREPTPREEPAAEAAEEETWDRDRARRALFATLRDAGIEGDAKRKAWAKENELPASTKEWGQADYERALETLIDPSRERYRAGCEVLGVDAEDFALQTIQKLPEHLAEYQQLNAALDALASEGQSELPIGRAS